MAHFSLISCQTTVKSTLGFPALFTLCHVHVFREHYAICRIRDYFGRWCIRYYSQRGVVINDNVVVYGNVSFLG